MDSGASLARGLVSPRLAARSGTHLGRRKELARAWLARRASLRACGAQADMSLDAKAVRTRWRTCAYTTSGTRPSRTRSHKARTFCWWRRSRATRKPRLPWTCIATCCRSGRTRRSVGCALCPTLPALNERRADVQATSAPDSLPDSSYQATEGPPGVSLRSERQHLDAALHVR
jgi:hypothetical protein